MRAGRACRPVTAPGDAKDPPADSEPAVTSAGGRGAGAPAGGSFCEAGAPHLMPRTSAGERSSSADRSLDGSTFVGPPRAYTPVYVLCRTRAVLGACAAG